jgi:ABC-type transport system involved in multi-copper enzyme maturation permease subunit
MIKLLNAGLERLKKNKVFISTLVSVIVIALGGLLLQYIYMVKDNDTVYLQSVFFLITFMISIIIPIFTSMFIGTEYANGTIRNKIIIGHKRTDIYFSNILISIIVGFIETIIYMILVLLIGIPLFGGFAISTAFVYTLFDSFLLIIVFSSIFTLVSMLCSDNAISSVGSIILIFILLAISFCVLSKLSANKYITQYSLVNNELVPEEVLNPSYITGTKRKVYQLVADVLPTGQVLQLSLLSSQFETINYKIFPLYSIIEIIIINTTGIYLFKRKDLK